MKAISRRDQASMSSILVKREGCFVERRIEGRPSFKVCLGCGSKHVQVNVKQSWHIHQEVYFLAPVVHVGSDALQLNKSS